MRDPTTSARGFFKGPPRASFDSTSPAAPAAEAVPDPASSPTPAPTPAAARSAIPASAVALAPPASSVQHTKNKFGKAVFYGLLGIMVALVSVLSVQIYVDSQKMQQLVKTSPEVMSDFERDALYAKVNRHMMLPDEKPLIRTVSEVDRLKNEPFYAQAQDGDKVLVFSRRAILYRPTQDRIVEMGFIREESPTPMANTSPSKESTSSTGFVAGAATQ